MKFVVCGQASTAKALGSSSMRRFPTRFALVPLELRHCVPSCVAVRARDQLLGHFTALKAATLPVPVPIGLLECAPPPLPSRCGVHRACRVPEDEDGTRWRCFLIRLRNPQPLQPPPRLVCDLMSSHNPGLHSQCSWFLQQQMVAAGPREIHKCGPCLSWTTYNCPCGIGVCMVYMDACPVCTCAVYPEPCPQLPGPRR